MKSTTGQEGFRRKSRMRMNPLGRNFRFVMVTGNTL
jgi:hypothetical protein